ncbi:MAG TPA: HAD-IA family hydrolase [Pilimelia sp.]|nr:HAD-IA family hydrolase [Pilimelia sp.]
MSSPASNERWIVLDVDDTLVDTFTVGWRKCREVARRLGLPEPTRDVFATWYGRASFEVCVKQMHPGVDIERYARVYDTLATGFPAQPLGDIAGAVEGVTRAGFRVGVLTNGPPHKTARKLAAAGLHESDFEFVRHGVAGARKPDARAFQALAAEVGLNPQTSWYVSDLPADWVGSSAAGFGCIGVISGAPHLRGTGTLPLLAIPRLEALVGCLSGLRAGPGHAPGRMRTNVTAVSFDAGFTLVEHVRSPADVVLDALRRRGAVADHAAVTASLAASAPILSADPHVWASAAAIDAMLVEYYRRVLAPLVALGQEAAASEVVDAYTAPDNWRARRGAAAALVRLRRAGIRVGVLSNWQPDLPAVLAGAGLRELLDAVVVSSSIGVAKPAAAAFEAMARALDVPVGSLVHVGDDPVTDAVGALAAGGRAILVTAAPDSPEVALALELIAP